jgi:Ca2+-binding EF-hand superfamily protein
VKLRQAYANGLASMQEKKGLAAKDVFRSLDVQGSGTMTKDAFFVGARITGVAINRQQADQLFNSLDASGSNQIDADTFASLTGGSESELSSSGRDPFARLRNAQADAQSP